MTTESFTQYVGTLQKSTTVSPTDLFYLQQGGSSVAVPFSVLQKNIGISTNVSYTWSAAQTYTVKVTASAGIKVPSVDVTNIEGGVASIGPPPNNYTGSYTFSLPPGPPTTAGSPIVGDTNGNLSWSSYPVASFNGRTGAIEPAAGDYSAGMISGLGPFATATSIPAAAITGLDQATTIPASDVTGLGPFATAQTIPASSITGLGPLAQSSITQPVSIPTPLTAADGLTVDENLTLGGGVAANLVPQLGLSDCIAFTAVTNDGSAIADGTILCIINSMPFGFQVNEVVTYGQTPTASNPVTFQFHNGGTLYSWTSTGANGSGNQTFTSPNLPFTINKGTQVWMAVSGGTVSLASVTFLGVRTTQ